MEVITNREGGPHSVRVFVDGLPPLEPPIAMMVTHAEREWIDRIRRRA